MPLQHTPSRPRAPLCPSALRPTDARKQPPRGGPRAQGPRCPLQDGPRLVRRPAAVRMLSAYTPLPMPRPMLTRLSPNPDGRMEATGSSSAPRSSCFRKSSQPSAPTRSGLKTLSRASTATTARAGCQTAARLLSTRALTATARTCSRSSSRMRLAGLPSGKTASESRVERSRLCPTGQQ